MASFRPLARTILLGSGLALLAGACSGDDASSTTGTTASPITSLPAPSTDAATTVTTSGPSTTLLPSVTPTAPPEGIDAAIAGLIAEAERVRALEFIVVPRVEVLDAVAFGARMSRITDDRLDRRDDAHTLLFRLLERLDAGEDLGRWRSDLTGKPEFARYDRENDVLVLLAQAAGYEAPARSEIIHEMIHALTDQHFDWSRALDDLADSGRDDRLLALESLVEGDATYFQLVYTQGLSAAEQQEVAEAFLEPSPLASGIPAWAIADLAFPFEGGFDFVRDLIIEGGIAAVDRAYANPPVSTEHILHADKYQRLEAALPMGTSTPTLDGYEPVIAATLGEWGLRMIVEEAMSPGILTQTADGWGGDAYWLFESRSGEVTFAWVYLGDSEEDTEEVTQAFIDFAEDVLKLGDAVRSRGGQHYDRNGRPWMFIDREGLGLLVVISSQASAGSRLADAMSPP